MAHFPTTYFPGTYFGEGYWRGITGNQSLQGGGTGTATGSATLFAAEESPRDSGFTIQKRKTRRRIYVRPRLDEPLHLESQGAGEATGGAGMTLAMALAAWGPGTATGTAEIAIRMDHTETDNAFWLLAA